jgi:hypothetical protein
MAENLRIEYQVSVTGLDEAATAMKDGARAAEQASAAIETAQRQSASGMHVAVMGIGAFTNLRQSVEYATKAIAEFNPVAMLYAFMNLLQTIESFIRLNEALKTLKLSYSGLAGVQAIVATLAGQPWLVAAAVAAGVAVAAAARSMQRGGPVSETGVYLLHRGEYVVPAETVNHFGPIYISFLDSPSALDGAAILREFGEEIARRAKRMGL